MASYNDIFSFFNQNAKFYYDDLDEKKRKSVEARILRDFRNFFNGEFVEYKNNVFYLFNLNIVIKFLFGESDESISSLKSIVAMNNSLFLAVRLFQGDYDVRVANLPLIKRAYQINYNSKNITGSVKWNHLEKIFNYNGEAIRNDASNILRIHDAIYQNYNINEEIERIYNYKETGDSLMETEKFILLSPEVSDICRQIQKVIQIFPSSFLNIVFSSGESLRREYFSYIISLLSQYNPEYISQEIKKVVLFKKLPNFKYKNKYKFIYQGINVDIHFVLNGFGDYNSFISESKYLNKVVLICYIDIEEYQYYNTTISMQGFRSKETVYFGGIKNY